MKFNNQGSVISTVTLSLGVGFPSSSWTGTSIGTLRICNSVQVPSGVFINCTIGRVELGKCASFDPTGNTVGSTVQMDSVENNIVESQLVCF